MDSMNTEMTEFCKKGSRTEKRALKIYEALTRATYRVTLNTIIDININCFEKPCKKIGKYLQSTI